MEWRYSVSFDVFHSPMYDGWCPDYLRGYYYTLRFFCLLTHALALATLLSARTSAHVLIDAN